MAGESGYSVGNLKIAFNTLDETSKDFGKLKANLKAVTDFINNINTANLRQFHSRMQALTRIFNPFLTQLKDASGELRVFNEITKQVGVKNISSVATQLGEIQQATQGAADGFSEMGDEIKDGQNIAQDTIRETTNAVNEQISATYRSLTAEEQKRVAQYQADNAARKALITYYEAELAMGATGKQAREYRKELEKLRKEDGEIGKKSGFQKFLGQIKRIAIYRLIRSGLKAVTSAFKDGISALAQFDSGINKTMSQLTTSFTVMKLSVSMALVPLLQSITPMMQQISVGFANMANVISASMSKTGYYTKINTDRLLAYNKAANLFDFDKFRSLNKGDDAMNLLSKEKVEDLNKGLGVSYANYKLIYDIIKNIGSILKNVFGIVGKIFQATSPIITIVLAIADGLLYVINGITWVLDKSGLLTPVLYAILGYFIAIGATKFITWLKSGALATWFKTAAASASTFGGKLLAVLGTTQALAVAIGALIGSISYYIQNLDKMSTTAKVLVPVISALAAVFTGLAVAKAAAAAGIAAPAMAGITAGALAAAIAMAAGTAISVGKFANGGMPDKGTMFVAGEAGAEMVYNMPSGQSGVANIQQIAQAVYQGTYQAIMDWWKSAKTEIGWDMYLDGEKIYQNTTSHASKHGKKWSNV